MSKLTDVQQRLLLPILEIILRDSTRSAERDVAVGRFNALIEGEAVQEILASLFGGGGIGPVQPASDSMTKTWNEWKEEFERIKREKEVLHRRVARMEAAKLYPLKPKPDEDGYIPFHVFLIGLLACRDWRVQDCLKDFCVCADVDQMTVNHWRDADKAPYYYYEMLPLLPLGRNVEKRTRDGDWSPEMITRLRELFSEKRVKQNMDVAKLLNKEFGSDVTARAVHRKAFDLGLLTGILRERLAIKGGSKKARASDNQVAQAS